MDVAQIKKIGRIMDDQSVNPFIVVTNSAARVVVETLHPSLFALYSAGWRNGHTVNGIGPGR